MFRNTIDGNSAVLRVSCVLVVSLTFLAGVPNDFVMGQRRVQRRTVDYTNFLHATHVNQQKLGCDSCHKFPSANWKEVRKEPFEDVTQYPQHGACLNCHRQQFFARERPAPRICLNCHTVATPRDTTRHPFPSVGRLFLNSPKGEGFVSEFRVFFAHERHTDAISQVPVPPGTRFIHARFARGPAEDSDPKNCSVCHLTYLPQGSGDEYVVKPPANIGDGYWLKRGTFKTIPLTHEQCFTCHSRESELPPLPSDCGSCHKRATHVAADFNPRAASSAAINDWWSLTAWSNRQSAGAFRHETHADQKCTHCHQTSSIDTTNPSTLKVAIKSCAGAEGCHVTATTDDGGALNYEIDQRQKDPKFVCGKCHLIFGDKPIPASHVAVAREAAAK